MKREIATVIIQRDLRRHLTRKAYLRIKLSTGVLQTGLRSMVARIEFRYRERTKAAIVIQVLHCCFVMHSINSLLLFMFSRNDKNLCRPIGAAIELSQTIRSLRKHQSFCSSDGK